MARQLGWRPGKNEITLEMQDHIVVDHLDFFAYTEKEPSVTSVESAPEKLLVFYDPAMTTNDELRKILIRAEALILEIDRKTGSMTIAPIDPEADPYLTDG